jgi:hypothetical protein
MLMSALVLVSCLLQTQMLAQESKRAKTMGLLLGHAGCLKQLCAVAGGRGQCDETLQLQALRLLQQMAATPPKSVQNSVGGSGKNDKAPLIGAIMGSAAELMSPLLRGLRLRPIRNESTLALLQLHASLSEQAPKLLAELLNQDGIASLLGLVASSDATEQIHDEISKLLRMISQSPLHGHRVEDGLAVFLPEAVVASLLAEHGAFRMGQQRNVSFCITYCDFSRLVSHATEMLLMLRTVCARQGLSRDHRSSYGRRL